MKKSKDGGQNATTKLVEKILTIENKINNLPNLSKSQQF
jgi:hypothetical protein